MHSAYLTPNVHQGRHESIAVDDNGRVVHFVADLAWVWALGSCHGVLSIRKGRIGHSDEGSARSSDEAVLSVRVCHRKHGERRGMMLAIGPSTSTTRSSSCSKVERHPSSECHASGAGREGHGHAARLGATTSSFQDGTHFSIVTGAINGLDPVGNPRALSVRCLRRVTVTVAPQENKESR
jgi:hypothetical protein